MGPKGVLGLVENGALQENPGPGVHFGPEVEGATSCLPPVSV